MTTQTVESDKKEQKKDQPHRTIAQAGNLRLWRDARGHLAALDTSIENDKPIEEVRIARCFPWSQRDRYVSVRDGEGREIILLPTLDEVDDATRALIEEELTAQEFAPRVTAILEVEDGFDLTVWHVNTDRGPFEVHVKHTEDVRQMEDGSIIIKDHAGGKFAVDNPIALDLNSQRLIEERLA